MSMSTLGQLKTSYLLILTELKKLFLPLCCQKPQYIPPPLPGIERVEQQTLLGIDVTDTLSTAAYVNRLLMQVNERLYLLSLL